MARVLMIDDDESLRGMVRDLLEGMGWRFLGAKDAGTGLRLLAADRPDVILLDINLPDMDGFSVCKRLKNDPSTQGIPLLLFSGERKRADDILRGLTRGAADGYLLKPVHPLVLKAKLEAMAQQAAP